VRGWSRGIGEAEGVVVSAVAAASAHDIVADEISLNEVATFSAAAIGSEASTPFFVVFVFEDAEAEHLLDSAVEIEERGADGEEDEDGEEVVEAGAEGG
jgi:hypothetical protein